MFVSIPDKNRRKVQGSVFGAVLDDNFMPVARPISFGSCTAELDIKPEYTEFQDNQSPYRDVTFKKATSRKVSLKFSYEQYTGLLLRQLYQATTQGFTQDAQANKSLTFPTPLPNGVTADTATQTQILDSLPLAPFAVIQLHDGAGKPVFNVTNVVVTDGNAALPAGSYVVDFVTGKVQLVAVPASASITVSFSAPGITAAQGVTIYNILQQPEFYAMIIIRQNNLMGQNFDHVFSKVHMPASNSVKLIGGDGNFQKSDVECAVLFDSRFPGQELGYATTAIATA